MEGFAYRTQSNLLTATQTITPQGDDSDSTRAGSKLKLQLFSKHLHIGIRLTVTTNVDNRKSTLHLPAIIETH